MFELVAKVAQKYPDEPAYEFYNKKTYIATNSLKIQQIYSYCVKNSTKASIFFGQSLIKL
jgi:hypothetical protein